MCCFFHVVCMLRVRIHAQMITSANLVETVVFKLGFCKRYSFVSMENLYGEQSDCKRRMNFNGIKLEVLWKR